MPCTVHTGCLCSSTAQDISLNLEVNVCIKRDFFSDGDLLRFLRAVVGLVSSPSFISYSSACSYAGTIVRVRQWLLSGWTVWSAGAQACIPKAGFGRVIPIWQWTKTAFFQSGSVYGRSGVHPLWLRYHRQSSKDSVAVSLITLWLTCASHFHTNFIPQFHEEITAVVFLCFKVHNGHLSQTKIDKLFVVSHLRCGYDVQEWK
jgi:hypothetical protein